MMQPYRIRRQSLRAENERLKTALASALDYTLTLTEEILGCEVTVEGFALVDAAIVQETREQALWLERRAALA